MLTAAVALPALPSPVLPALAIAAGALAVIDAGLRFRRPGGGALLAILELIAGLLLLVRELPAVQPYVSTTIEPAWLAAVIAVIAVLQLIMRAARRNGLLWLTIVTLAVSGAAAALTFLGR